MQPTRKFLCQISTQLLAEFQNLQANDLGSGSSGSGNKYLADDMTWKPITTGGSPGPCVNIDFGTINNPNSFTKMDYNDLALICIDLGSF